MASMMRGPGRLPASGSTGKTRLVRTASMASQPAFDLQVPGRPDSSIMDAFARRGFDVWCVDMEGYGRSDKHRDINCDVANGADDLEAATEYILRTRGISSLCVYGGSSGALRAGLFAQRWPERVKRLALAALAHVVGEQRATPIDVPADTEYGAIRADLEAGGTPIGSNDLLIAALGACTSMTVSLYARRKQWPLESVTVTLRHAKIHVTDCENCEKKDGMLDHIERDVKLHGVLTEEQRERLRDIANKGPVHKTLTSKINITTRLV